MFEEEIKVKVGGTMVKASQLTDQQLVEQISKYEKIVRGLQREREKRVQAGVNAEILMTEREKSLLQTEKHQKQETATFTVEISDEDIRGAAESDATAVNKEAEDQEDLMRVTRLLKLSKKDLEELNKEKHEAKAQERAEAIKSRRKKS